MQLRKEALEPAKQQESRSCLPLGGNFIEKGIELGCACDDSASGDIGIAVCDHWAGPNVPYDADLWKLYQKWYKSIIGSNKFVTSYLRYDDIIE
ncbi:hypothetical protein AWU65_14945 [Paenibacillus glucanolyticus]|uniref:Uncharacterized protein n=1 Tax=Paenibacillus glucanolyticus TaxID=59843 RepID=A0A163KCA6_9BACL|nr:hypothetical protein AWU65_14945 [Paenibacillus glucanolyticus]